MAWPYSEVANRTIDAIQSAVGKLYEPHHIRAISRAETDAKIDREKRLAAHEQQKKALYSGKMELDKNLDLIEVQPEPETAEPQNTDNQHEFLQTAEQQYRKVLLKRAINLQTAAYFAIEHAIHSEETKNNAQEQASTSRDESQVDDDWISKWRNGAQDVSKEHMQRLWGRLLAGEAASPGTYSLHTLDLLQKLTVHDAELINRIAPYCVDQWIPKFADNSEFENNLNFEELLYLNELGLLGGVDSNGLSQTSEIISANNKSVAYLKIQHDVYIFYFPDNFLKKKFSFEIYSISKVLREILTLSDTQIHPDVYSYTKEKALEFGANRIQMGSLNKYTNKITNIREIGI